MAPSPSPMIPTRPYGTARQSRGLAIVLLALVAACSSEPTSLSHPRSTNPSTTTTEEADDPEMAGVPGTGTTSSEPGHPASPVTPPVTPSVTPPVTPPREPPVLPPPAPSSRGRWVPRPAMTWQWQLSGPVDTSVDAEVFDIDLDVPDAVLADLTRRGRRLICYVSVGAWEEFRDDAGAFPAEVLGAPNGWPGERWVDIRRLDVLGPIIERRFDRCAARGFDAVEPDNVDGYANDTGFPLTYTDQIRFNRFIAEAAHARGLSVGLKNDVEQAADLEPYFDFAVNEECVAFAECRLLAPFFSAGKAVFHAEYSVSLDEMCRATSGLGFSSILKSPDLDAAFRRCR